MAVLPQLANRVVLDNSIRLVIQPLRLVSVRRVLPVDLRWVVLHRVRILAPTAWLENSKATRWNLLLAVTAAQECTSKLLQVVLMLAL